MGWPFLFGLVNLVAWAGWLLLGAGPRGPKSMAIVLYAGVGLLCLAYALMFAVTLARLVDAVQAGAVGEAGISSIEGIRALFATDAGIVIGWTHYLAFDLFVGLWIAKDADHKNFSRLVQLPVLAATLFAGPIGLIAWLLIREGRARRAGRMG